MKKQCLIMAIACFLFAGSQVSFAQSKLELQTVAKEKTDVSITKNVEKVVNALERQAKLDSNQKNKIYDIFVGVDKKIKGIASIEDLSEREAKETKMQSYINEKLKQVLSKEQYAIYLKRGVAY